MKRLLIIVLLMCFLVSTGIVALAKVSFGGWDKWDEELPPAGNRDWHWIVSDNEAIVWNLIVKVDVGVFLFSDLYFYGSKSGKIRASVFFYSSDLSMDDVKKWTISDAGLALAAFPPEKGKMMIRAYKMEENKMEEDKVFKFFEEWEIPFKNQEVVVPEDVGFRVEIFKWFGAQVAPVPVRIIPQFLPELVIKKKLFRITNSHKF